MKVGIVGAGLIGSRRAEIVRTSGSELVAIADSDLSRAQAVAGRWGGQALCRWEDLVSRDDIDAVIVSTPNSLLMPIALAALKSKKHVLVEKPMGRTPEEVAQLVEAAQENNVLLRGGFNHRYHPALQRAWEYSRRGMIGDLLYVRARYGHGGRSGYEKEWRCDPKTAGGGEMLDQGIHLVDLARWFLGDFEEVTGFVSTSFWPIASLEDNAFLLMRNKKGQIAQLHASWTQWKNLFSFELYGAKGSLTVEGLGGSYGTERLRISLRRPQSGPPEETEEFFPGPDMSWQKEWDDFTKGINQGGSEGASGEDGLAAIRIVYALYAASRNGSLVRLTEQLC